MKQRLASAMSLLSNPKLVMFDKPTNGLDIEGVVQENIAQQRQVVNGKLKGRIISSKYNNNSFSDTIRDIFYRGGN